MQRGDVVDRLDVGSFSPALNAWREAIAQRSVKSVKIGDLITSIRYGTGSPPPRVEPSAKSVPFLRATNIKDGQVFEADLLHISRNQPKRMEKCKLSGGELIIVRSGVNTGDCAVVPQQLQGAYAAYDLIVQTNEQVSPEFLCACLYTSFGKAQINAVKNRAAQPHINAEEVKRLEIPHPSLNVQRRFVAELDAARAERDNALAEAECLIGSIDEMVKEKLKLPEVKLPEQLGYAIRLSTIKHNRTLSADYFHPERMVALRAIQEVPNAPLSQLVKFKRKITKVPEGRRYIGLASITSNTGQLSDAEETATGQCVVFERGDVLYGRLRPYLNKVWLADFDGVCSTEFYVMQPLDQEALRSEYLAVVIRASLIVAQTKYMMTGNTHPRIANDGVKNLLIPLADYTVQQTIVEETLSRQAEVLRLRAHAETVWREARERFEQQLLQGGN